MQTEIPISSSITLKPEPTDRGPAPSRAIRLSQLHAINWYGYQDSLPISGNLVLAGVTGSGKSILMDLLMLVLVGPERARHHFNRSATGTQSDRTLKGYCLLDTKREENGQAQFFHDKGVTTYVAAEFTWPDGERTETWGLRIEFRNSSEADGHITPFHLPSGLVKDDFIQKHPETGARHTLDLPSFRQLIEARQGRIYASSREYLREMHTAHHLNFNREVLDRLLPSAMSFTNLKSFDDFCRRFVLPSDSVPIADVVASYRDFQSYESELQLLKDQLGRLQNISSLAQQRRTASIERDLARHLAAELHHSHSHQLLSSCQTRLEQLKESFAGDEARLLEIQDLITDHRRERERLLGLMHESSEGRLYHQLTQDGQKLETELNRLREVGFRLGDHLRKRIRNAQQWLKAIQNAALPTPPNTLHLQQAIRSLEQSDEKSTASALILLRDSAESTARNLRTHFAPQAEELRLLRQQQTTLKQQIESLQDGLPPIEQPLLRALNHAFLPTSGQPTATALREHCEVTDEAWRPAIEVAFTDKFAVLVPANHYPAALEILHQLPPAPDSQDSPPANESIIDPQNLGKPAKPVPNSLAGKLETAHPIARAYIDQTLGPIACVTTLQDLIQSTSAILPDGLLKHQNTVRRPRHYDGIPFVGKRGLARQLQIKQNQLQEVQAKIRLLEPIEIHLNELITSKDSLIPDHSSLTQDLVRVEALPHLQEQHENLMQRLQEIDTGSLQNLSQQAFHLQEQTEALERERLEIARKGAQREIEQTEKMLAARRDDHTRRQQELHRIEREIDVTKHLAQHQSWKQQMLQQYLTPDVTAREFEKEHTRAAIAAAQAEGDLKAAMVDFKKTFAPRFDDFPEDGQHAEDYDALLQRIDGQGIPEFEAKAAQERKRWESIFRTQVLTRMHRALKDIDTIILLLNKQLKRPIGNDSYRIEKKPNPEYRFYRDLIHLNATKDQDDLFFDSLQDELKEALDHFLQTLVHQANSPEANRLLDYRQYFDYDLLVSDIRHPEEKPVSVDKQSGKMSGGENQSPYFVAILASYLHAYHRHETRRSDPSLALVPIDEAFSKLSGERIQDCLAAMQELDLQGVFSMSSGNIPFAFSLCDQLIVVTKTEKRMGAKTRIRNIPAILYRDTPEGRQWMARHGS